MDCLFRVAAPTRSGVRKGLAHRRGDGVLRAGREQASVGGEQAVEVQSEQALELALQRAALGVIILSQIGPTTVVFGKPMNGITSRASSVLWR